MGKNTMMKRSIRLYCEEKEDDRWAPLLDELVGNVGIIFTKADLASVSPGAAGAARSGGMPLTLLGGLRCRGSLAVRSTARRQLRAAAGAAAGAPG
jgi:hypothetical protein